MAKKRQIRLNEATIKALIKEAIQDKLNGVFSTDDPKAAKAVRDDEGYDDFLYPEDWKTRKNREDLANLIDKRSRGEDAELGLESGVNGDIHDQQMEKDALDNEKVESDRYLRPFGDLDDTENLWSGDPDLESDDDEEGVDDLEIAGIGGPRKLAEASSRGYVWKNGKFVKGGDEAIYIKTHDDKPSKDFKFSDKDKEKLKKALKSNEKSDELDENKRRQVRLNESQLREFVSYSVARILREAMGRPIFDKYGEYDGAEEGDYGEDSFVFEPDLDEYLSDEVDFPSPIQVEVSFTSKEGRRGDGYMQPNDSDSYELNSWRIVNDDIPMEVRREVKNAVKQYMENDFDLESEASMRGGLYEENKGAMFHSDGKNAFKPKNPYANMTWKEYCEAKAKEHEDEKEREKLRDLNKPKSGKKNLGVTTHFDGKKK